MQNGWTERIEELEAEVAKLTAERDADRRREYGYSQQTVDALTAERDSLKHLYDKALGDLVKDSQRISELEAENTRLRMLRDAAESRAQGLEAANKRRRRQAMNDPENLICPFCGDDGFDKIGLKIHLTCWCDEYQMVTVGRYSWSPEAIRENEDEKCKRRGETSVERDKLEAENAALKEYRTAEARRRGHKGNPPRTRSGGVGMQEVRSNLYQCDREFQIEIGGGGFGYRPLGPKFDGSSRLIKSVILSDRDKEEIIGYVKPDARAIEEELADYKAANASIREELRCRIKERDKLEDENKRLREALKGLLQEAIVLTDDYLSMFETYHDTHVIQGWDKARWVRVSQAARDAREALKEASHESK